MDPLASSALEAALSGVLQVLVFAALPWLVYVVSRRGLRGFLPWLGLRRAPPRLLLAAASLALLLATKAFVLGELLTAEGTVSGRLLALQLEHGPSPWLWVALLLTAWVKTGLSEELFFRGFVGGGLVRRLGFRVGNVVQAVLFGAIHLPLLLVIDVAQVGLLVPVVAIAGPTLGGWLMGWLNHRADGSILPGWIMHATGNTIAYALPLLGWVG